MKKKQLLKKLAVIMLVFTFLVGAMPTSTYASSSKETINGKQYSVSFDKSFKVQKKIKVNFWGKKVKTKLKFGTVRVKGYAGFDDPSEIAYIKIYHSGKLIAEGEVDKDGASIGRGFNVKAKGFTFRLTPQVKYYPSYGGLYLTCNVKGNGVDIDPVFVPLV